MGHENSKRQGIARVVDDPERRFVQYKAHHLEHCPLVCPAVSRNAELHLSGRKLGQGHGAFCGGEQENATRFGDRDRRFLIGGKEKLFYAHSFGPGFVKKPKEAPMELYKPPGARRTFDRHNARGNKAETAAYGLYNAVTHPRRPRINTDEARRPAALTHARRSW